jgi:EAL domain-containing protein (putative c-di-GMP-specific phosphodiesterase class I)
MTSKVLEADMTISIQAGQGISDGIGRTLARPDELLPMLTVADNREHRGRELGRLSRPTLPPGPLNDLVRELHALHARAGRPSTRDMARSESFSYTAVHDLFTKTVSEAPRLPVLHRVVERLAGLAPRTDVEEVLERFDLLWRAADERPFDEAGSDVVRSAGSGGPADQVGSRKDLVRAVRDGQLVLVYQPVVRADGTIVRAEALVRWRHPTRGLLRAAEFLPRAARSALMQEIDLWLLRDAVDEAVTWSGFADPAPGLVVNISDLLLTEAAAAAAVVEIVERAGLRWDLLTIELTEDCFRGPDSAVLPAVTELIERGARIAVDDFGTGYSSLAQLADMPAQGLNIAPEFVAHVTDSPAAASVIRAICDMAHAMGRTTTAENVETVEQFTELRRMGVDAYQGRLFAVPVPPEELRDMIARGALPPRDPRW